MLQYLLLSYSKTYRVMHMQYKHYSCATFIFAMCKWCSIKQPKAPCPICHAHLFFCAWRTSRATFSQRQNIPQDQTVNLMSRCMNTGCGVDRKCEQQEPAGSATGDQAGLTMEDQCEAGVIAHMEQLGAQVSGVGWRGGSGWHVEWRWTLGKVLGSSCQCCGDGQSRLAAGQSGSAPLLFPSCAASSLLVIIRRHHKCRGEPSASGQ